MSRYMVFAGEIEGQLKPKILLPKDEAFTYAKELEGTHKLVAVCHLDTQKGGKAEVVYSNFFEPEGTR